MYFSVRRSSLGVLLLLVAVSAIKAAPTISNCSNVTYNVALSLDLDIEVPDATNIMQFVEYDDSAFAAVAADLLKAPADITASAALPYNYSKNLPAVPGTVFMVLSGFLCVSLVNDRRLWLAVFAGLLWTGQAGIQALPQLALRLNHRNHIERQFPAKLAYSYQLANSSWCRSDIEGTRYISLLRYLEGVPVDGNTFSSPSATIESPITSYPLLKCLAFGLGQFVCFSPAFIFNNLPRGPPNFN